MDKVRPILAALKKHHFWIVSAVVSVAILGCWYTARASLSKMTDDERTGIVGMFSNLETIKSNPHHPNPKFKEGVELEKEQLKKTTDAEWQRLYERQRDVFIWPEALPGFKDWDNLKKQRDNPVEGGPNRTEIMGKLSALRQQYQGFINSEFPKLQEFVRARREKYPPGAQGSAIPTPMVRPSAAAAYGTAGVEMIGVVDWDLADFEKMKSNLKTWNTTQPTEREVELCHESLAIYRSLLEAIARVNANATDNENAIVKRITQLDIGKEASMPGPFDQSSVIMPAELVTTGSAEGGMAAAYGPGQGMPPMEGAAAAPDPDKLFLLNDRYLDGAGAPVTADAALNSPPFAEFKLMKVRLILVVNQKGIPTLLAELANAKLGVEVHQVRINPQNSTVVQSVRTLLTSTGAGAGGPSNYPGGGRSGEGGMTRPPMSRMPPGYGPNMRQNVYGPSMSRNREGGSPLGMSSTPGAENPNDATVEIKGIMYIYNPYNSEKTGSGTDTTNVDQRTMFGFAGASGAVGATGGATAPALQ